jgi:hypothetical protein
MARMSTKPRGNESDSLRAAQIFDEALGNFRAAMEAVQRGALNSAKNIERAAQLLTNVAEAEERMRAASQALSSAINDGHTEQLRLARLVTERAETIAARTVEFQRLIERYGELGTAASSLNQDLIDIVRKKKEPDAKSEGAAMEVEISTLRDKLDSLAQSAQELLDAARAADFEDVIRQADSIRQQLLSARNKLGLFGKHAN